MTKNNFRDGRPGALEKREGQSNLVAFKGHLKEKVKTLRRGKTSFTLKPDIPFTGLSRQLCLDEANLLSNDECVDSDS
jgi:hypothetical protein